MSLDDLALAKASTKLLDDIKQDLVYSQFFNRDYEGDVKYNGAVKIFQAGFPTVNTYTRDSTTISYERLEPGEQILIVTQRKYFALKADDLEKQLAAAGGQMWQRTIRNGAYVMAQTVDAYLSGTILAGGVPTANQLAARTLGLGMGMSAYDLCVDLARTLRDNNVVLTDAHVAVPPIFYGLLKKDQRFSGYNTPDAQKVIRGEVIGVIDNLQLHMTTAVPVTSGVYTIIAGTTEGATYAEQLSSMENVPRSKDDFDDRVRSQLVYDGKVTQPQCYASCAVSFAS